MSDSNRLNRIEVGLQQAIGLTDLIRLATRPGQEGHIDLDSVNRAAELLKNHLNDVRELASGQTGEQDPRSAMRHVLAVMLEGQPDDLKTRFHQLVVEMQRNRRQQDGA
ncbi:MAG: hypothetical protein HQL82_06025 [Magnetococcales bacterium]|nr:hypothetical protein [Magnetococcales bacterium]